jgi:hypothetical protein
MRMAQYAGAVTLFIVFAVFATANIIFAARRKSLAPVVGGMAGLAGCLLVPSLRWFCWIPLIADIGTLMLPLAAIAHLRRRNSTSS